MPLLEKGQHGGGIGVAWHKWNSVGVTDAANERVRFNDYAARFRYQGIAGLAVPIPMVLGLEIMTRASTPLRKSINRRKSCLGIDFSISRHHIPH